LRLSQSSSIRRRRSSGVRSPIFSAGLLINPNMPPLRFSRHAHSYTRRVTFRVRGAVRRVLLDPMVRACVATEKEFCHILNAS
jgi:hypothetical protein